MPRNVLRLAAWLLLVPLLATSSGCTVIGYGVGHEIDRASPDLDTLSVAKARKRPALTPVTVLLRDHGRARGRLQTVLVRDPLAAHRALAETLPRGARLPLPGETLQVVTGAGTGKMVFERLAGIGDSYREDGAATRVQDRRPVVLFSMGPGAEPMAFALDRVDRLVWPDGSEISGPELSRIVADAGLPDPRVLVLQNGAGRIDSIPAWKITGVEAPRIKDAQDRGIVIGLALDCLAAWMVVSIINGLANSGGFGGG